VGGLLSIHKWKKSDRNSKHSEVALLGPNTGMALLGLKLSNNKDLSLNLESTEANHSYRAYNFYIFSM